MTKISIPSDIVQQQLSRPQSAPSPVRYQVTYAIVAGLATGSILAAAYIVLAIYWPAARQHWSAATLTALSLAIINGARLAYRWTVTPAAAAWHPAPPPSTIAADVDTDILPDPQPEPEPATAPTPAAVDAGAILLAGYQLISRHYAGLPTTRPECARAGMSQSAWNAANQLLQALEIKAARSWRNIDQAEALRLWSGISIQQDGTAYVSLPSGSIHRVDLSPTLHPPDL